MYLTLWLEGALQSYGDEESCYSRSTASFPTKSAVLGMILYSMDRLGPECELLAELTPLELTSYRYVRQKNGKKIPYKLLMDFQTVGTHVEIDDVFAERKYIKSAEGKPCSGKIINKQYLQDVAFGVIVEIPDEYGKEMADALTNPARTISLGRNCCLPCMKIYWKSSKDRQAAIDALEEPKTASESFFNGNWVLDAIRSDKPIEGDAEDIIKESSSIPISFGDYDTRRITTGEVYTRYM